MKLRSLPSEQITSQQMRPIRACREYEAAKFSELSEGVYLYDFGYNMAGVTRIKVRGEKGAVVKLRHGERLSKIRNLRNLG